MEVNDRESEMKRTKSKEESNNFNNAVKGHRMLNFSRFSTFICNEDQVTLKRVTDM